MEATFNYQTGEIKRDFKIVECGSKCKLAGLPTWVGEGRCLKCKHKGDMFMLNGFYIACTHPEQKDTDNWRAISLFNEELRCQALRVL